MNRSRSAFTLIEVLVATSILGGVMIITMTFMDSLTNAAVLEERYTVNLQMASRAVETICDTLRMANIAELPDDGTGFLRDNAVAYQVPVETNGLPVDKNLQVVWGVKVSGIPEAGSWGRFEYVATEKFSEADREVDLNQDGDMDDGFYIGHLAHRQYSDGTFDEAAMINSVNLTPDIVIQSPEGVAVDLNGDGLSDPLFSMEASVDNVRVIRVTIIHTDVGLDEPRPRRVSLAFELVNRL